MKEVSNQKKNYESGSFTLLGPGRVHCGRSTHVRLVAIYYCFETYLVELLIFYWVWERWMFLGMDLKCHCTPKWHVLASLDASPDGLANGWPHKHRSSPDF
jgi:hypothetical protein